MTTRRELLEVGAVLAAGSAVRALAAESSPRTLLILGGTGFIGPHLTLEAQRRGWRVTHFNRGKTAADGMNDVESLVGDRKGQLDALLPASVSWLGSRGVRSAQRLKARIAPAIPR